jgi:hypothetical protein
MAKLFLALSAFLLVACGTEAKNLCPNNDCRTEKQKREQCSAQAGGNFHEITLKLKSALPGNLAVDVNGERRYDDCTTPAQKAPFVSVQRAAGNRVIVRVDHGGAFPTLPASVSVSVINLQACEPRMGPEPIFTANDIALTFSKEGGAAPCPPRDVARVSVQQP